MTDVGEDDLSYCLGWCYELNPYRKYTDEFERFIDDVLELEKECFEFIEGTRDEVHKKLLQDKMHDILEKSTSIEKIEKIKDEIEKDDQLLEDKHIDRLYDAIKQVSSFFEKEQYLVNVNNLVDKSSQIFNNSFNFENQYIEDYYIFCILTLNKVLAEEEKYKEIARYNFERIFSLFLFQTEADIIYEKICSAAEGSKKEIENYECTNSPKLESELIDFVIRNFDAAIFHDIYCSSGIFYRVSLAGYILDSFIDKLLLGYKSGDYDRVKEENQKEKIRYINKNYQNAEKINLRWEQCQQQYE